MDKNDQIPPLALPVLFSMVALAVYADYKASHRNDPPTPTNTEIQARTIEKLSQPEQQAARFGLDAGL